MINRLRNEYQEEVPFDYDEYENNSDIYSYGIYEDLVELLLNDEEEESEEE